MRVAFLYNRSSEDPAQSAEDDVPCRSPIMAALVRLGHDVMPIECTLNLAALGQRLISAKPDVVFNRVESLGGTDAMMPAITLLLDSMRIAYTGCPTEALVATASKIAVKQRLLQARLPTPPWLTSDFHDANSHAGMCIDRESAFIIKAVFEHASFRLDDKSLIEADPNQVAVMLRQRERHSGRPHFAEQFIAGREFNLSLIAPGPQILPPAEIEFSGFPIGKPHIIGYDAKCNQESFEYCQTERRFDFPDSDRPLIRKLTALARDCWRLFGLRGYARVDFRCDATGQPWIIDINANPCILPDAGFAAAWEKAGIAYDDGVEQIINNAVESRPMPSAENQSKLPLSRLAN